MVSQHCQCIFLETNIKIAFNKDALLPFLQTMEKSALNVKSLLKRLFSLARHPSSFKRLGAALAFNNIYTIFRYDFMLHTQLYLSFLYEGVIMAALVL